MMAVIFHATLYDTRRELMTSLPDPLRLDLNSLQLMGADPDRAVQWMPLQDTIGNMVQKMMSSQYPENYTQLTSGHTL